MEKDCSTVDDKAKNLEIISIEINNSLLPNSKDSKYYLFINKLMSFFRKFSFNFKIFNLMTELWFLCSSCFFIILLSYIIYGNLISIVLLHFSFIGLLYKLQDFLLYHPDQPPDSRQFVISPLAFNLPHESIFIKTIDGVKIHLFAILQSKTKLRNGYTFVYFHGNAGNIGHRISNAEHMFRTLGANVFLVEYRGYGRSEGEPSEEGLLLDAKAALEYVFSRTDLNCSKIIVFGRSLGGAIAIQSVANTMHTNSNESFIQSSKIGGMLRRIISSPSHYSTLIEIPPSFRLAGLIVENTFTSIPDISRILFNVAGVLNYLPDCCYKNKFVCSRAITHTSLPVLMISGLRDELVPPAMMQQLYQLCPGPMKRLLLFSDGTHNETSKCDGYYDKIALFLGEIEQLKRGAQLPNVATYSANPFEIFST